MPSFDFTGGSLPGGASITRSSVGTRFNASGVMETIAANLPRFDYDPVARTLKGLLLEAPATNLLTYTDDFSSPGWSFPYRTANATASPNGSVNAPLIKSSGGPNGQSQQNFGTLSGSPETSSFFLKYSDSPTTFFGLQDNTTGIFVFYAYVIWSSGAPSVSIYSGAGTITVQNIGGGWYRLSVTCTGISGNNRALFFYPETGGAGSTKGTYAFGVQHVVGGISSYISSTTAAAARAAEILMLNWASLGVADGACFVRLTYDDLSTAIIASVVVSGLQTIAATSLARPWVRKIEYLSVPTVPPVRAVTLKDLS
jgi:hypothetical protein